MKNLLLILYLMLFFYQNSSSQTITSNKGLTTIIFNTTHAVITVYLPDDLQNGDNISGTFNVFNEGLTDIQMEKSLQEVRKYKFNFSNPVNQTSVLQRMVNVNPNELTSLLPLKITTSLILTLTESSGKIYKAEIKPNGDPMVTVDNCLSPEHFLLGDPLRITGTFDGNASNTRVSINNTYFKIMAESPRQSIVETPEKLKLTDKTEIIVVEDFKPKCTQSVSPVKMTVVWEKGSLKKGETTTVFLTIKGLEGITVPAHFILENKTPKLVSLTNGNKQDIEINSGMIKAGTDFSMNFIVQGIMAGEFTLDFNLELPEDFPGIER